jgi:hypothetical protein
LFFECVCDEAEDQNFDFFCSGVSVSFLVEH